MLAKEAHEEIQERFKVANELIDEFYEEMDSSTELGELYTALIKSINDIPVLLDELNKKDEIGNRYEARLFRQVVKERDNYKRRSETLENTIHDDCKYCKHVENKKTIMSESGEPCNKCCWWENWQFDEARFSHSGGDEKNTDVCYICGRDITKPTTRGSNVYGRKINGIGYCDKHYFEKLNERQGNTAILINSERGEEQ